MTDEEIQAAVDQGVADKIKFLGECREAFILKNQERFNMWLRHNDPNVVMLPYHQDNNTGECTWLNRKARRG